jgi:hypothetical protein
MNKDSKKLEYGKYENNEFNSKSIKGSDNCISNMMRMQDLTILIRRNGNEIS